MDLINKVKKFRNMILLVDLIMGRGRKKFVLGLSRIHAVEPEN
jgi:hypothetical protein